MKIIHVYSILPTEPIEIYFKKHKLWSKRGVNLQQLTELFVLHPGSWLIETASYKNRNKQVFEQRVQTIADYQNCYYYHIETNAVSRAFE